MLSNAFSALSDFIETSRASMDTKSSMYLAMGVSAAALLFVAYKKFSNRFVPPKGPYSSFIPSLPVEQVRSKLDVKNITHYWYPLAYSEEVTPAKPYGISLLGEPLCLYRDKEGRINCVVDRCPHRSAPLSIGKMVDGNVECVYHGWQFSTNGKCTRIPSVPNKSSMPSMIQAVPKPVHEENGWIWVWAGPAELAHPDLIPRYFFMENKNWAKMKYQNRIKVDWGLMMDNLLDFAHIDFTHDGYIGSRSIATAIKSEDLESPFREHNADAVSCRLRFPEATGGDRKINVPSIHFLPPCFIRMEHKIDEKGKKLIQHFVNVPLTPTETKTMISFEFTFLPPFLTKLPFAQYFIDRNNTTILNQDLELLFGIERNARLGAPLVGNVVSADILIKKYREWRESAEKHVNPWFKCWSGNSCRKEHIVKKSGGSSKSVVDIEDMITE